MIKRGVERLNHTVCDFMTLIAFTMNDTIALQLERSISEFVTILRR